MLFMSDQSALRLALQTGTPVRVTQWKVRLFWIERKSIKKRLFVLVSVYTPLALDHHHRPCAIETTTVAPSMVCLVVNARRTNGIHFLYLRVRLFELETPDHLAGGLMVYNRGERVARWMDVVRCNNNKEWRSKRGGGFGGEEKR